MHRNDTELTNAYLATWTTPEREGRRQAIHTLWAPSGQLSISSTGETLVGREAIAAHIDTVHDALVAGKGLRFSYDQSQWAGDALLLRWSMAAPDATIAGRGVDILHLTPDGLISTAYMFMGIA